MKIKKDPGYPVHLAGCSVETWSDLECWLQVGSSQLSGAPIYNDYIFANDVCVLLRSQGVYEWRILKAFLPGNIRRRSMFRIVLGIRLMMMIQVPIKTVK